MATLSEDVFGEGDESDDLPRESEAAVDAAAAASPRLLLPHLRKCQSSRRHGHRWVGRTRWPLIP